MGRVLLDMLIVVEIVKKFPAFYRTRNALNMEAASTSETSVNFCQTTLRSIPADSHLW
jgi:hypothetical protein